MIQKPFLYVTNPETFIIYKYQFQDGKYKKFGPHIPQEFELMNVRQQQQYRQWKALKFMMWSIFNKDKIQNPIDFRIILCRLMDLNTNVFLAIASTIGLRYFLMKLQSPFMDYYFEDRLITFPKLKKGLAYSYFGFALYFGVKSVINQEHIFDLSLEYE